MKLLDEILQGVSSVAISGHVRPDGDCVGSCLAVYHYIRKNYPKTNAVVMLDPIPDKFRFLKHADEITDPGELDENRSFDLFICLDCSEPGRLGKAASVFEKAAKTVCIDHHLTNGSFADVNRINPNASSASELVFQSLDPEKIDRAIAECLYLGIVHDTGVFQYSCTSPGTMQIAGELMSYGIDYPRLIDETYYIKTYQQQRIWGKAQMDSILYLNGRCIVSMISAQDMKEYGVKASELDGIVSTLRSTTGVEVSVFFYEIAEGYKLSLRSASFVDVAAIASAYGGGGHARAAGASVEGTPEQILPGLLKRIRDSLEQGGLSCITES